MVSKRAGRLAGRLLVSGLVLAGCAGSKPKVVPPTPVAVNVSGVKFRLKICSEKPVRLDEFPGEPQSRGCVVTFQQDVPDRVASRALGATSLRRRYLVYAPTNLPAGPVPVVFVFPGKRTAAETAAFQVTHTRFETLADRDGFVVVYGNGVELTTFFAEDQLQPNGGYLDACFAMRSGENIDVTYVREIVRQLGSEIPIDRSRIFATGLSAGGGFSLELALEAPDLVAAVAPVAPVPFQPTGPWLRYCDAMPGYQNVSIAMLAATADPHVSYGPGNTPRYPRANYPGMEETRDAWLKAMGIHGAPVVERFPDVVTDDSYEPASGTKSSTVEVQRYPPGPNGQEFWYFKAEGMGHWWPSPKQIPERMWPSFGKSNQDIEFADLVWEFFQKHPKRTDSTSRN